jgi:hypothetical protein
MMEESSLDASHFALGDWVDTSAIVGSDEEKQIAFALLPQEVWSAISFDSVSSESFWLQKRPGCFANYYLIRD